MQLERVQKFIAESGYCSRRKAEEFISRKLVKVNGKTIKLGDKCYESDKITVNNKLLHFDNKEYMYIVMNKAKGYVCSKSDPHNKDTVFDKIRREDRKSNLNYVGRLDKPTTGLLILTNDGRFANKIIHPSSKVEKTYEVDTSKELTEFNIDKLQKGIKLDGVKLNECKIRKIGYNKYEVIISEGKKRQIRRMIEYIGNEVRELHRTKIGKLDIKKLKINNGQYKKFSKEFLEKNIW